MSATDTAGAETLCKTPRTRILRLRVEAELCPNVTSRVFDLLSRQSLLPLAIAAERGEDSIRIEIDLESEQLPEPARPLLVDKIEAIVMVRSAGLERR